MDVCHRNFDNLQFFCGVCMGALLEFSLGLLIEDFYMNSDKVLDK
jgi:hypothetical protein